MSAVQVLDEALVAKTHRTLSEMAVAHPRSIAALIRGEHFDAVVEQVARIVDVTFPDFESALIAACSKVREKILPRAFFARRERSNALTVFARKTK